MTNKKHFYACLCLIIVTAIAIAINSLERGEEMKPIGEYRGVEREESRVGVKYVVRWCTYPHNTGYEVSTIGAVRNRKNTYLLKQIKTDAGYWVVTLSKGMHKKYRVHRLVLETFVGDRPIGMECNHKDGNKGNNKLYNLEWTTHQKNIQHAYKIGLRCAVGEKNGQSKLTSVMVKSIRKLCISGKRQIDVADRFNISRSVVSRIVNRRLWDSVI